MVDSKQIQQIAKLSMLEVAKEDTAQFANQLSKALDFFEQISEVDTTGVEPMMTPTNIEVHLDVDSSKNLIPTEQILACAPERTGNLYTVPPVV